MASKSSDPLYVGISHPVNIRRDLLLSQKGMISCLKGYESFKEIRKKKIEAATELKHILQEIHTLMRKLRTALPKTDLRAEPVSKKEIKKKPISKKSNRKRTAPLKLAPGHKKDTLELLEEELLDIEKKLEHLG